MTKKKKREIEELMVLPPEERMEKIRSRLYRTPTKHDWLFIETGTEYDIPTFFVRTVMCPSAVILAAYYLAGIRLHMPLTYLLVGGANFIWWMKKAFERKEMMKRGEWPPKITKEQLDREIIETTAIYF